MDAWDLIVVGAGSSGAALAARSAELGKRVLLLEAGTDYRAAAMAEVWRSPNPMRALLDEAACAQLIWPGLTATRTEHQPAGPFWRGRGVGGSSAVNGQIAIRPPVEDFADWARGGCDGWAPEDVLPYFAKLEDDEEFGDAPHHGRGGPIPIHRTPREQWGAVDAAFARAASSAGHPWAADVNAPGAGGVSPYPINSRDGRRVTTNDGYLEPARQSPNLTIRGDALVTRVLLEGHRAVGVEVAVGGDLVSERAAAVVLSAGVIHSPAVLMRSGIGPADQLRSLGIDVVEDLPVGPGLQDHPVVFVGIALNEASAATSPDARHTNACLRYASGHPEGRPHDMLAFAANQNVLAMAGADVRFGAGAFGVWVNQVYSEGGVTLRSADPTVEPEIHLNMLSDERDRARLRDGIRMLVELARSHEVAAITAAAPDRVNEELSAVLDDDAQLDARLLDTAMDAQHGTSTCRMGSADDPRAVVAPDCRVHGCDGLYVADASIFPTVPRANTNLAAIMVGELVADRLG
jgi:choline dehydrogenase-like flavoprotein